MEVCLIHVSSLPAFYDISTVAINVGILVGLKKNLMCNLGY
jgi:hypothetical protein